MTRPVYLPCGYAPDPEADPCPDNATLHIAVGQPIEILATEIFVGLLTCAAHAPAARRAGRVVGEHTIAAACASPKAIWVANSTTCSLDKPAPLGIKRHAARRWHPADDAEEQLA